MFLISCLSSFLGEEIRWRETGFTEYLKPLWSRRTAFLADRLSMTPSIPKEGIET